MSKPSNQWTAGLHQFVVGNGAHTFWTLYQIEEDIGMVSRIGAIMLVFSFFIIYFLKKQIVQILLSFRLYFKLLYIQNFRRFQVTCQRNLKHLLVVTYPIMPLKKDGIIQQWAGQLMVYLLVDLLTMTGLTQLHKMVSHMVYNKELVNVSMIYIVRPSI